MTYMRPSKTENLAHANSEEGKKMRGTIPAGTLCHCQGIPFLLLHDVEVYTNPANIQLMEDLENWPKCCEQKQG